MFDAIQVTKIKSIKLERVPISKSMNASAHETLRLCGHQAPVTALSRLHGDTSVLASAAEDGAVRIWDVAAGSCTRTIAVTSTNDSADDIEFAAITYAYYSSDVLYAAAGQSLVRIDLREPHSTLSLSTNNTVFVADDDINSIDLHAHTNGAHAAVSDDTGRIHVIDMVACKPHRRLRSTHSNIASVARFRPRRPWELWSGGYDHAIMRWDASTGSVCNRIEIEPTSVVSDSSLPSVNPPFVLSFAFDASGHAAAAGLGDGSIECLAWTPTQKSASSTNRRQNTNKKRSISSNAPISVRITGLHRWSVSALEFVSTDVINPATADSVGSDFASLIVSGSLDGSVGIWSLHRPMQDQTAIQQPNLVSCTTTPRKINALTCIPTDRVENVLVATAGTALESTHTPSNAFAILLNNHNIQQTQ